MSEPTASIPLRNGRRSAKPQAVAQQEITRLQQIIAVQTGEMNSLLERLERMSIRENELRDMLLDAHDQLMRRDDEILATLHGSLQQQVAQTQQPILQATMHKAHSPTAGDQSLIYQEVIHRIRTLVDGCLPPQANVIVVSKGDNELLKLGGRSTWHFPQIENGVYAGYYPVDSAAAIAHLEALRAKGGQFLLFPQPAFWWLEHYAEFKQHLDHRYQQLIYDKQVCLIYALAESTTHYQRSVMPDKGQEPRQALHAIHAIVRNYTPPQATLIVLSKGDEALLDLDGRTAWHFPQTDDGRYTSYYPGDSVMAIHHLEGLRVKGGQFLILPGSAFWWLRYYPRFHEHLDVCYRCIYHDTECIVYDLRPSEPNTEIEP